MSRLIRQLTGASFDRLLHKLGAIGAYRLRYGDVELTPTPRIKKFRSQPADQLGPSELTSESVMKWKISLPMETLTLLPDWKGATSANRLWLVTEPNETLWIPAKTEGDRLDGERGHVVITIAAFGIEEN